MGKNPFDVFISYSIVDIIQTIFELDTPIFALSFKAVEANIGYIHVSVLNYCV